MKILVALPDKSYFLWQMLVQINNFKKFGLDGDLVYVIGKHTIQISDNLKRIMDGNVNCEFHVVNDTRIAPKYSSSLRPHILNKFFEKNQYLYNEPIFYIDPDVIFTQKIDFNDYLKDDIWYLSDTRSYINSKYIKSKGEGLFYEMCESVDIDPMVVENNDTCAGGAQYIMKNIDHTFWKDVETDSEKLFKLMVGSSVHYSPKNPIQAWTADMWAVLWNAWKRNITTNIVDDLNFSWATDPIKKWKMNKIYHNAGAISNDDTFFVKMKYQTSPFNKKIKCSNKYCSFNYLKEIKDTEKNFKDIIF